MPRLSRGQYAARLQIQQLAGRALLPAQLSTLLLRAIARAIPSDMQVLLGVDSASLLFNRLLALQGGEEERLIRWLEQLYLVREPALGVTFPGLMRAGLAAVILRDQIETSWGISAHLCHPVGASEYYHLYHEIDTPAGGVLRACFAADGVYIAAVELLRHDAHSPFQPGELAFLRQIAPLVGQALRAAFDREQASLAFNAGELTATGVLVLAPDKKMTVVTPAAQAWLDHLRAREHVKGPYLPTAVVTALASLHSSGENIFPHRVFAATPAGLLRVEASLADEDGTLAVTLAPQLPLPLPKAPVSWPLTRQERTVCDLLLRGQSNRQIAAALVVSENTVESHCAHIYEKLQVHSRQELLGLFFQQVYRSSFHG